MKREFCLLMNAIIFANGEISDPESLASLLKWGEFLISADGGLNHLRNLGLMPNLVIGDLDSVSSDEVKWLEQNQIEIIKYPKKKDQSDMELALLEAVKRGGDPVVVIGALGGRIDQILANIFLLLMPELMNVDVRLDDGHDELFLIQDRAEVRGKKGDIVSLMPMLSPAKGIKTMGLKYSLNNETLLPEHSRGVSNVMETEKAEISLKSGLLLCIHTRKLEGG
jgi:thiamine pyrophosphokinase